MLKAARVAILAAGLTASASSVAHAEDQATSPTLDQPRSVEFAPGVAPNAPTTERRPLMMLLDRAGIANTLDQARIDIFGHIEGSYTYNFDDPAKGYNVGRVFDFPDNKLLLNQLDLNVQRRVDLTTHQFDVGGRAELLYGSDARFIHSSGMFDSDDFFNGPEYQFDIPQLYVDLGIPIGNGLRVRAGKFLFFKQIDPNNSVFYSHSFSFGGALPFTLTGLTGYYPITESLSIEAGISRGWGQTFKDNNGAIDALGRVRYTLGSRTDLSLAAIIGPELDHDNSHYRTVLDATLSHALTDQLTLLADAVFGYQALPDGQTDALWYGASGYGVYQLNNYIALAARLEWYRDEEGFTTGLSQSLFEATVGVTLTPFPEDPVGRNLRVRPELRFDYSTKPYFDALSRHDQTTIAIEAYFNF